MLNPCGCDCSDCREHKKSCEGCREIEGKVFWAEHVGRDVCPMYDCCINEKKLPHCGKCDDLPCEIHYSMQDPSTTKEEHEAGIRERVEKLRNLPS